MVAPRLPWKICRLCGRKVHLAAFPLVDELNLADERRISVCQFCVDRLRRERHEQRLQWYQSEEGRQHKRARKTHASSKRRAAEMKAMPAWADQKAINRFYLEAQTVSKLTGVKHHVDHIVPLQHEAVCGLHVPANLQVIPGTENVRKNNKFRID